jgi:hypothetical protein
MEDQAYETYQSRIVRGSGGIKVGQAQPLEGG